MKDRLEIILIHMLDHTRMTFILVKRIHILRDKSSRFVFALDLQWSVGRRRGSEMGFYRRVGNRSVRVDMRSRGRVGVLRMSLLGLG